MITRSTLEHPVILVVDDEALLRMCAIDFLEDAGFTVLEAANVNDALQIIEVHSEVCLLFTDVNMPGKLSGMDLAREVHNRRPDIRLLVTSGQENLTDDDIPNDGRFLTKPYDQGRVVSLIGRMLRLAS